MMGRTFYPRASKYVEASAPHPEGTEYKVSVGAEDWEGQYHTVVKIQMTYNGKVAGRKSPSYPIASDDYARVASAISELLAQTERSADAVIKTPAAPSLKIAAEEYVALVCKMPRGQITRSEDIEAYLCRIHHVKKVMIESFPYPPFDEAGKEVPYWRVVGTHGYISDDRMCSRERKTKLLQKEGLQVEACGTEGKSLRVLDYKTHLADLNEILDNRE